MSRNGANVEEHAPLVPVKAERPSPDTLTKLVKRLRALTLTLLPVQVATESINDPTSRIITPQVVSAYKAAAGDFIEALPYCLLRARAQFMWDANHNPADYDENYGRAIACEVLARRIVHQSPPDRLMPIVSTRLKHIEADGDESDMASALEMAIDTHCKIFLSSSEAQDVVNSLWNGDVIQKNDTDHGLHYVHFDQERQLGFWRHFQASRLSVPRYQNFFRIIVWLVFLVVYSQAVREPLLKVDPGNIIVDGWEIALYVMALSFCVEDLLKWYKLLRFVTWRAISFWDIISFITDALLLSAFILRVSGIGEGDKATSFRYRSFQLLSFVAPLIWMKLITVFDGYKYIGMMQICVARMLQESGIFFALLSVLALGFGQGLYALDAADGSTEHPSEVLNVLVQALLQSPNYDKFSLSPAGLTLYYFWNLVTAVILLNVLISLFASAYSDVVDDAEAEYLAFFAGKTVGMIRAPDEYVYPAPFNLLELFLVAPFETLPKLSLSQKAYAALNRYTMSFVFFIPLSAIALFEVTFRTPSKNWMKTWFEYGGADDCDSPAVRDPQVDSEEERRGLQISRVPFMELIKVFPNTQQSSEGTILKEIGELREQIGRLMHKLEQQA